MPNKIVPIALSGYAQSGKDTFYSILKNRLKTLCPSIKIERVALADVLKSEIRKELLSDFNIDILNCSIEEKNKVRRRLIDYGLEKRIQTSGRYFIEKADQKIKKLIEVGITPVITDCRYCLYPKDELYYVKKELNALLIFISKHDSSNRLLISGIKEEEQNNPHLYLNSDYKINWRQIHNAELKEVTIDELIENEDLVNNVDNFIEFYTAHIAHE